jgi:NADH dehydrogenase
MPDDPADRRSEQSHEIVTVFGGTGFLGRRVVRHLLDHGFEVRAASRHPERVRSRLGGDTPGLAAIRTDIHDGDSIAAALAGASAAVNAVSLYVEHAKETFEAVHVEGAGRVARFCREASVKSLMHVSGIGADPRSSSRYIQARGQGEIAVRDEFPGVSMIRPSVMFGHDDAFLTTLVRLIKLLPVFPMFGRGGTMLQPVYVEDVGEAISRLAVVPPPAGAIYELAGPRVYTYRSLLTEIARGLGLRRGFLPMPFPVWKLLAAIAEYLPTAGLTRNQVELMQHDNVASGAFPGLHELGIEPTRIEDRLVDISSRLNRREGS